MISETQFARQYASAWRTLTPMSEQFVRNVNGAWCEQVFSPIRSRLLPFRRWLRNEIAFRVFVADMQVSPRPQSLFISNDMVNQIFDNIQTDERWRKLRVQDPLYQPERQEVETIWRRLIQFFCRDTAFTNVLSPSFSGCGIIDSCAGDIICGDTLYEVKAAGRFFRSIDLRQLLIYSALNKQAGTYGFVNIGVFNPRVGVCYRSPLSEVCYEVSGKSADELLGDIIETASGADISH